MSHLLAYRQGIGDVAGIKQLGRVSPVAWPHVNLHGRFQFNDQPKPIDMDNIVQTLAQMSVSPEVVTGV